MSIAAEPALVRFSRRAMATTFEIALPLGTHNAARAAEDVLALVDRLESQLSVFRGDSEVSQINRLAAHGWIEVEPRLFSLLELSLRIYQESGSAFDIAAGSLIRKSQDSVESHAFAASEVNGNGKYSEKSRESMAPMPSPASFELDSTRRAIRFLKPGVGINLGSIGKGYALDRAAELLKTRWNTHRVMLHGGSSSVLAIGAPPEEPRGWQVGLGDPRNLHQRLGVVHLTNQGLGTSAATFQGQHILNPRTGEPAQELLSASVIAPTAAEADALATAFFVLGVEGARLYCEEHPDIGAVLLPHGQDAPIVIGNVDFTKPRAA